MRPSWTNLGKQTINKQTTSLYVQEPSGSDASETVEVDGDKLREMSRIYACKPIDHLLRHHSAINDAAYEICKANPSLVNRDQT